MIKTLRPWLWIGLGLAILIASAAGPSARPTPAPAPAPGLVLDATVAPDFGALATTTWDQFLAVFAARSDCFGDVHLRADPQLKSRAAYDPTTATVTVRVPGTPAFLREALVHEWAHHVEFQCAAHQALRPAFLSVMGFPPDAAWQQGNHWEDRPSERYAETTVEIVLGRRQIRTEIHVTPAMVETVKRWIEGLDPLPPSPDTGEELTHIRQLKRSLTAGQRCCE